jgi:hypothetical protein
MAMSEHNTDSTIEVGDLVRVVAPKVRWHPCSRREGYEFVVDEIEGEFYLDPNCSAFYHDELTIMKPKDELESVYSEEKRLEEKKDKCFEVCSIFIKGGVSSYNFGRVTDLLDNLQQLLDED